MWNKYSVALGQRNCEKTENKNYIIYLKNTFFIIYSSIINRKDRNQSKHIRISHDFT